MRAARSRGNGQIKLGDEPTPAPITSEMLAQVDRREPRGSDERPSRDGNVGLALLMPPMGSLPAVTFVCDMFVSGARREVLAKATAG